MTEEWWANWKTQRDRAQPNQIWKGLEKVKREEAIKDKHPDELFAICRTDNNYWRHYRASPKLTIDELSMMICREVGCDLQYCQHLSFKPKNPNQQISDCMPQYNAFRECVIREKRIFRGMISKEEEKNNKMAIPEYLEKHFKQKEKMKKERQMMGTNYFEGEEDELRAKIDEMDEQDIKNKKVVNTAQWKQAKKAKVETYI